MTDEPLSPFRDAQQARIHRRLSRVGPGAQAFYEDACALMGRQPPLATTTHLVAHCLREIESALRAALQPIAAESGIALDPESTARHKDDIGRILQGLAIPETDPTAVTWLRLAGQLQARAHRNALAPPRRLDAEFEAIWTGMQEVLDRVLDRYEARYLAAVRVIDELLAVPVPTREDAKRLQTAVPNDRATLGYFFDHLTRPAWLPLLQARGFFSYPPAPERDEEEGTIRFPDWPAARYLARIAAQAHRDVLDTMLALPVTDNANIHGDLIDAALALPPSAGARWAAREAAWVATQPVLYLDLPARLGQLIGHLAGGGEVSGALDLTRATLAILPDPEPPDEGPEALMPLRPRPRPRMRVWDYQRLLATHLPTLVGAAGDEALTLVCDLLEDAIRLSLRAGDDPGPEDHSQIWRRAVERDDPPHREHLRSILASAARDTAQQLAAEDTARVPALVTQLMARPWRIFQRLALHLLRRYPDRAEEDITRALGERANFDAPALWHEYALLLRDQLAALPPTPQETILGWITAGPTPERREKWRRGWTAMTGTEPTDEQVDRFGEGWIRDHLAPLRDALPAEEARRYVALVEAFGEPVQPEFPSYREEGSWSGPVGPLSADEVEAIPLEELLVLLETWRPPDDPWGASREGLADQLRQRVATDPAAMTTAAERLVSLHPLYQAAILKGLRAAVQGGADIAWPDLLALCEALAWPATPRTDAEPGEEEAGRDDVRVAVTELVRLGLQPGGGRPFASALRPAVWRIIARLAGAPHPLPGTEPPPIHGVASLLAYASGTTLGAALCATIDYALWVRRQAAGAENGAALDALPELWPLLDTHLEANGSSSRAIRTIYGESFPVLLALDTDWATARATRIFTDDGPGTAAWDAYLADCRPSNGALAILRWRYARAVEDSAVPPADEDVRRGLVSHLLTFYLRGVIALLDPTDLLPRFFERAPAALRVEAFDWLTDVLRGLRQSPDPAIQGQIEALWDWRLDAARQGTAPADIAQELAQFGRWFYVGPFAPTWAIAQLRDALQLGAPAEDAELVLRRIAEVAPELPRDAVEGLEALVRAEPPDWVWYGSHDEVSTILRAGLAAGDPAVAATARETINRLAARGHHPFRALLADDPLPSRDAASTTNAPGGDRQPASESTD